MTTPAARSASPFAPAAAEGVVATGRVAALRIYPVKSLGAVELTEAMVGSLGLASGAVADRRHALVDGDGRVITQRERAVLALARVTLGGDAFGTFTVAAPGRAPLAVATPDPRGERLPVQVFDDSTEGVAHPAHVDAWFSEWLGVPCRLVHMPDDVRRPVDPRYAAPDDRTGYADGFPILVATRPSLDALNGWLAEAGEAPVGMERFRANVVLDGDFAPFAEDGWRQLHLGAGDDGAGLALVKPCARCVMTTIDPRTAERGREPLRTLARRRRVGQKVLFAQNAVVRAPGLARVGDVAVASA